jgi:hypothetical protein
MEFFSPAGARCDPNPAITLALYLLSFSKWDKRYKILRKKIRIHENFDPETATRLFSLGCGCKRGG